jgi:hypothetical protein
MTLARSGPEISGPTVGKRGPVDGGGVGHLTPRYHRRSRTAPTLVRHHWGAARGGSMKLDQLNKKTVTEKDIEGTEEYRELVKNNDPGLVLTGCILYLRGDFKSPADGIAQAKLQMQVAHTARREMIDKTAKMKWAPSGNLVRPETNNSFINLILGQGQVNLRNGSATMNCWEAVIVAAILDGAIVNPGRMKSIYESKSKTFTAELVYQLSGKALQYQPQLLLGRPVAGDVVMFSGLAHVALSTGTKNFGVENPPYYPGLNVISFWPAPRVNNFQAGTLAEVEVVTIESIVKWIGKYTNANADVTFGCPNWRLLGQ